MGQMEFKINLKDVIKPNPPNKKKLNLNNEGLSSSDSKKDDISIINLNQNNKRKNNNINGNNEGNPGNNTNEVVLHDKNKKNVEKLNNEDNLINENDDTKINGNKINESYNEEEDRNFGSKEFYECLMKIPEEKRMDFFDDEELNGLDYQYAVKIDKRSFCSIYLSVLKRQNVIILSQTLMIII